MANATVGGAAHINVGGQMFSSDGKFSIEYNNFKREVKTDSFGNQNYTVNPQPAKISGTLYTLPGFPYDTVVNAVGVTVTIACKNGDTISLVDATFTGDGKIDTAEGTFEVEWQGKSGSVF